MTKEPFPSDKQDKFMLRLPDGMRDRIKSVADANNRSMNAEIVSALEEKFPIPSISPDMQALADYLNFIESAENEDQQKEFLETANYSMLRDKVTAGFMFGLTKDESGIPSVYITKRK